MPKKFVSLISQNFHFRVSGIFVKHETKFGRNFRNFGKNECFLEIKKYKELNHCFILFLLQNRYTLIMAHLGKRKFLFS